MFSSTKFYLFLPNPKSSHLVALYFLYHYSFLLLLAASFWACYAGSSVFISPCPCILQPLHTLTSSEVFLFSSCFQSMLTICCSVYPLSLLCMSKLSQLCIFKFRVQRLYNNTEKHQTGRGGAIWEKRSCITFELVEDGPEFSNVSGKGDVCV